MAVDLVKLRLDLESIGRTLAAISATLPVASVPVPPPPAAPAGYVVKQGRIYDGAGQRVPIRGINHHGFNGDVLRPQLLWVEGQQWDSQLAQMKALGFNAIRVPFVPDTLYDKRALGTWSSMVPSALSVPGDPQGNDKLRPLTSLQALDLFMAECERLGLYVLLDFHSVSMVRQFPTWFAGAGDQALIYNKQPYTKAHWIRDLVFVAKRYAKHARFLGIDLYNEPNGMVRWSSGDANMALQDYFWAPAAAEAAKAVLAENHNLLVFVQGIAGNYDGREQNVPMNWGEDFQPQAYQPLAIPDAKLVLTPHTYPGGVYQKSSFSDPTFPKNLAKDWETLFGQFFPKYAVIPGEWGGQWQGADAVWQTAFVDYLLSKGMTDSLFWCWANSGDTGSVLDNDGKVNAPKMANLHRLWGV